MRETRSFLAKRKAADGDKGSADVVSPPLDAVSGEPHVSGSQKVRESRSSVAKRKAAAGDKGTTGLVSRPLDTVSDRKKEKVVTYGDLRRMEARQWAAYVNEKFGGNNLRIIEDDEVPDRKAISKMYDEPKKLRHFKKKTKLNTKLKEFATLAIKDYNDKEKTSYEVVEIMSARTTLAIGTKYYLTFRASRPGYDGVDIFDAAVVDLFHKQEVVFIRIIEPGKRKSSGVSEPIE